MSPDWHTLSEEVRILSALVSGLARKVGCGPDTVLDAIAEELEHTPRFGELRLVDDQSAA